MWMWKIENRINEEHEKARFRLRVLEIMKHRLENSLSDSHGHGEYDERSDFDTQFANTVEELKEMEG